MRKNKIIILCLLLVGSAIKAEIWPTLSIVELAIRSDKIVEAKYLGTDESKSRFLIQDLQKQPAKIDTITLFNLDRYFYDLNGIQNADSIILYLTEENTSTSWSGLRVLKDNMTYVPFQNMNPGKFVLGLSRDSLNWNELKRNIIESKKRIDYVKELEKTKDNRELLKWIQEHGNEFILRGGINENMGWGSYGWDVFKWITENNEAKSTWKASKLFKEIHFPNEEDWLGFTGLLGDENGTSFKTYEEINFLIETALDESIRLIDRRQALVYLKSASRKVYENNYPIPESQILNNQKEKQRLIRNQILPLLKNDGLKRFAFQVIRGMSNPMDGILEHRIDLEILPTIEKIYQNETPGDYKSELAEFIVYNSSKEKWKILSNCDEKIFVDLYQVYVDTNKNILRFGINYDYGKEQFHDKPKVVVVNRITKEIAMEIEYSNFNLPYNRWNGVRYLETSIEGLTSGLYKVYTTGKAGEKSEFNWVSEYGEFRIE